MSIDDFEKQLLDINNSLTQSKMLQIIYQVARYASDLEQKLMELQNKFNEIIIEVNAMKEEMLEKQGENK